MAVVYFPLFVPVFTPSLIGLLFSCLVVLSRCLILIVIIFSIVQFVSHGERLVLYLIYRTMYLYLINLCFPAELSTLNTYIPTYPASFGGYKSLLMFGPFPQNAHFLS